MKIEIFEKKLTVGEQGRIELSTYRCLKTANFGAVKFTVFLSNRLPVQLSLVKNYKCGDQIMKYIVNAIWKHDKLIDEEAQRDYMSVIKPLLVSEKYLHETIWYKIDDHTQGSVGVYKSKEAYEEFLEGNKMQREFAAGDIKVTMLVEYQGPVYALQSEVD